MNHMDKQWSPRYAVTEVIAQPSISLCDILKPCTWINYLLDFNFLTLLKNKKD